MGEVHRAARAGQARHQPRSHPAVAACRSHPSSSRPENDRVPDHAPWPRAPDALRVDEAAELLSGAIHHVARAEDRAKPTRLPDLMPVSSPSVAGACCVLRWRGLVALAMMVSGSPGERCAAVIPGVDEPLNGDDQVGDGREATTAQGLVGEGREERLDQVEPGARGRGKRRRTRG